MTLKLEPNSARGYEMFLLFLGAKFVQKKEDSIFCPTAGKVAKSYTDNIQQAR
jgi:hypothetical protein